MADLIYTRRPDDRALTFDEVAQLAPAAFNRAAHPETSDRYSPVSTLDAMAVLRDYGFHPVQAAQKKARTAQANRYAQHLIAFAQDRAEDGETRPEIVLYNSHDGGSSLKLFGGAFRFICSNGIVAGDGYEAKARHVGSSIAGVEDMLRDVAGSLPGLMDRIDRMRGVQIDRGQALEFAYNAAALRWEMMPEEWTADDAPRGSYADDLTARYLLNTRRRDDAGADLWRTFNRVQEGLIRGGARIVSFTDKAPFGKPRKAKAVGSVSESVRINRDLWNLSGELIDA